MPKLITASCFVLFWVFYEMSGGADFTPRDRVVLSQAPFAQEVTRNVVYQKPVNAVQVTNASYVPVSTEPLTAIQANLVIEEVSPATPAVQVAVEEPAADLRIVSGNRVNLRQGPGTTHPILDTLPQGTTAEVIGLNDNGWAHIRLIESGKTGWMAARLLSEG